MSKTDPAAASDGLPPGRRMLAVLSVGLGITMAVMDSAIANVALPTISRDLAVSAAASIWIVNAYQLAVTISLLPCASLGDIVGHRRVFRAGLALFTLASLGCALSHSLPLLAFMRVVQGLGAAGIMCCDMALVRFSYPSALLGRAVGAIAMIVAVSAAVSPTVAASILSIADWPWLFAINVPIGIVALFISARSLPPSPPSSHRFDVPSAALSALTFGMLIMSLDGFAHGTGLLVVAGQVAATAVLAVVLVRHQSAHPTPILPVDLFRRPIFSLSAATSVCAFATQGMAYVTLPFYLQDRFGLTPVATGLLMTPWPFVVVFVAPLAGRLSDRFPAGILGGIGLAVLSMGLVLLAFLPAAPSHVDIVWRMMLCGIGFGLFQTPNNRALMGAVPRERSGSAGGVLATARLLGQTTGAALVALVFAVAAGAAAHAARSAAGSATGSAAGHGTVTAILVAAGFAAVAAVASLTRLAVRRA